eukprot:10806864-Karenia_brevis.AAC.1
MQGVLRLKCSGKDISDSDWHAIVLVSWMPANLIEEHETTIWTLHTSFACAPLILGKGRSP